VIKLILGYIYIRYKRFEII